MIKELDFSDLNRRDFFKTLSCGSLAAMFPWLQSCSEKVAAEVKGEKLRLGIIGTGSRGMYHLNNLLTVPQVEVVALCDDYEPNLLQAAALYPKAVRYGDYCKLLEN
ncbi:MAG: gfo/Idh/MocA family oxidoreductase, partial [Tannerella sp.]|nr:gfo/Idh/MocA family oxidoreductase [Tannerella sp.]